MKVVLKRRVKLRKPVPFISVSGPRRIEIPADNAEPKRIQTPKIKREQALSALTLTLIFCDPAEDRTPYFAL
jgi:hypothetical protein